MFNMNSRGLYSAICIFIVLGASVTGGSYKPLLTHVPESANVLVLIDVPALQNSNLGAMHNVKKKREMAYLDQPILVPPSARNVVVAGDMDTSRLDLLWGISIISLFDPVNMEKLVQREDGLLDSLAGKKTILSPLNAYFIELERRMIASVYPARRQFACRWIQSRENATVLSPYLQKAVEYAKEKGNDIVMALDLKEVPSPFTIARRLESSKVLAGTDFDAKKLTKLLASIEGITLVVGVDKKASGKIVVHFGENTWSMKEYAKDLLLEILSETGATVDDFNDWQVNVVAKVVTLEGDLTIESLRRILSLIEIPTPTSHPEPDPDDSTTADPGENAPQTVAEKSQEYFETVKRYVEDLRMQAGGQSGQRIAVWMEKYAVKIENLPILNIDEDLQNYGADVAYLLRGSGDELRGMSRSSQARQAQYHKGTSATRYGRYGGVYGSRSNRDYRSGERKRVALEEKEKGFSSAIDVFRKIDAETSQIRRLLTQRYQVEF
jgi:hypothetical protein